MNITHNIQCYVQVNNVLSVSQYTILHMCNLFNEFNAGSKVHPKVNELPLYAFFLVFLLLQHKHMMIKKLLQLFIGKINAQLFQAVILQNMKRILAK